MRLNVTTGPDACQDHSMRSLTDISHYTRPNLSEAVLRRFIFLHFFEDGGGGKSGTPPPDPNALGGLDKAAGVDPSRLLT